MNRFLRKTSLLMVLAGMIISGCGGNPTPEGTKMVPPTEPTQVPPQNIALKSDKARIENPQVPVTSLDSLEAGNRAFALALYQQLRSESGNLFYSPYSISLALAMTYAGARGETEAQMAQAMHFDLVQADLHTAFNALSQALAERGTKADDQQEQPLTLNIANALWGQQGFSFQPDFLDTLAQNYGAGMQAVDYSKPEQARAKINDWVAEQTKQKIKDLIPEGALDDMTRLVLTNAIYFKANWQYPFEKTFTTQGDFNLLNGDKVQVDMMHETESLQYVRIGSYQAVELPYAGSNTSMLVILPDACKFDEVESSLDPAAVVMIQSNLEHKSVELSLPKFKVEDSFSLNQALSSLGMPDAFDPNQADFSGMTGKPDLYISDVVHKAYVDVNEEGTEAAAATGVIMKLTSAPISPVVVSVDRPFIFMILDKDSGTILFMGRVLDPR